MSVDAIGEAQVWMTWSGGATNIDPSKSLGGGPNTSTKLYDDDFSNLFLDISENEAKTGNTQHRCIYVFNDHDSISWKTCKVFVSQKSQDSTDIISVGAGTKPAFTASAGGAEPGITNQASAPSGVTFSSAANSYENGVALGDIPPNSFKAIWIRRQARANTAPLINNYFTVSVQGLDR